jgi:hypothetical protein
MIDFSISVTYLNNYPKVFDHKNNLQLSELKKGLELDFVLRHIKLNSYTLKNNAIGLKNVIWLNNKYFLKILFIIILSVRRSLLEI